MVCIDDEECALTDAMELAVPGDDNGCRRVELDLVDNSPFDTWKKKVVNEVRRCAAIQRHRELKRGVDGRLCEKRQANSSW